MAAKPPSLIRSSWFLAFVSVAVLVLAQISWWAYVFVNEVQDTASAHRHNVMLSTDLSEPERQQRLHSIERDFTRRRNMFVSESLFFALMTCLGLALLFRALRSERRAQEQERSFIEIVTHESKTPLTALKLRLESIVEQWGGTDRSLGRELELARQEVLRLNRVVEKTIDLNRLERARLTQQPLSLTDLVHDILRRLDPFFRTRGVEVQASLEDEVWIYADAPVISTAVQNLIENAVMYNDSSTPRLTVELKSNDIGVQLRVIDNGPGVPVQERESIFERLYRGEAGRRVPGMGLGLYLARGAVQAHGGSLRVGDAPERGAVFEILLPVGNR